MVLPSRWEFPPADSADEDGLVAIGGDLAPGTVLAAYRSGIFPMPLEQGAVLGWWSPDPRAIIPLDAGMTVSASLARSRRRYRGTFDADFLGVIDGCAEPTRPHGWITPAIRQAYGALHELGWAHSAEVWDTDGRLVGGVYGIAIGGFFAGESMFYRARDASKVALASLVEKLQTDGFELFDVQWQTPHLASLGAVEVGRKEYLHRLRLAVSPPDRWS